MRLALVRGAPNRQVLEDQAGYRFLNTGKRGSRYDDGPACRATD